MKLNQNKPADQGFSFPPPQEFERVIQRARKSDKNSNFLLPPDANELDKAKYKLCKDILRYKHQNKLSTENMAQQLELSISRVERILYSHIDKFHLDELIIHASKLRLPFEVRINSSYANQKPSAEAH